MNKNFLNKILIVFALVKRDYSLQYAGSIFGMLWIIIQSLSLIFIYGVVFIILNFRGGLDTDDFFIYMITGLIFWIPLNDYLVRGTSILTDNRTLIKRSSLGVEVFLWVPLIQYFIHSILISIPVIIYLIVKQKLNLNYFILSYPVLFISGSILHFVIHYLSRVNILLKDITPIIRLFSQFLFWSLPILYVPKNFLLTVNHFNPIFYPLELFRYFFIINYPFPKNLIYLFPIVVVLYFIKYFSKNRLQKIILDHI